MDSGTKSWCMEVWTYRCTMSWWMEVWRDSGAKSWWMEVWTDSGTNAGGGKYVHSGTRS